MFNASNFYKFINGDDMKSIKIALTSMFLILSSYASAVEISSNVGLSSDYIWRGMTQTNGDIAVNGGFDLSTDNGFYFGTWASNASAGTASMELDIYIGFSGEMAENMTYDVGYISVIYPGNDSLDFEEAYVGFNIYGLSILYSDGQNDGPSYSEVGYSIDAGPGSFNISYASAASLKRSAATSSSGFRSGWFCIANLRYADFMALSSASRLIPSTS